MLSRRLTRGLWYGPTSDCALSRVQSYAPISEQESGVLHGGAISSSSGSYTRGLFGGIQSIHEFLEASSLFGPTGVVLKVRLVGLSRRIGVLVMAFEVPKWRLRLPLSCG